MNGSSPVVKFNATGCRITAEGPIRYQVRNRQHLPSGTGGGCGPAGVWIELVALLPHRKKRRATHPRHHVFMVVVVVVKGRTPEGRTHQYDTSTTKSKSETNQVKEEPSPGSPGWGGPNGLRPDMTWSGGAGRGKGDRSPQLHAAHTASDARASPPVGPPHHHTLSCTAALLRGRVLDFHCDQDREATQHHPQGTSPQDYRLKALCRFKLPKPCRTTVCRRQIRRPPSHCSYCANVSVVVSAKAAFGRFRTTSPFGLRAYPPPPPPLPPLRRLMPKGRLRAPATSSVVAVTTPTARSRSCISAAAIAWPTQLATPAPLPQGAARDFSSPSQDCGCGETAACGATVLGVAGPPPEPEEQTPAMPLPPPPPPPLPRRRRPGVLRPLGTALAAAAHRTACSTSLGPNLVYGSFHGLGTQDPSCRPYGNNPARPTQPHTCSVVSMYVRK
ncbi:hypothetical protein VOLCADRAFT_92657 [Volvox carteri f. nagariensis]|uniref:Uncharacterized protein n=1 Tax=Volvox carteri f. nagariensis TaxID=3068 RepID=D8U079_VOLCA|nr:uncharacterized protein VOLCADRAFT_92657 [Volvox carteri f. nagariensis]EFJ46893.1 hypothetical protein VOLCADRAFT_92657 [Volvox carteri f. nagariensis]|eukprot:XP_002952102.1 hypothetical protein VOLCADRAFT_92657 [Volvox carteri f. nagariensis]